MSLDPAATVAAMRQALRGRPCHGGLDLSSNRDLTALAWIFPEDHWAAMLQFWIPEEGLEERVRRDRVPYDLWARDGWISVTPGNVIDYSFIRSQVLADAAYFSAGELAFDPWRATETAIKLRDEGLTMVECRQGFATLSEPSKFLETLVFGHHLSHGGHPVLRWMAENVSVATDPAGNIKPVKEDKSIYRIDGVVALIMAIWRAIVADPAAAESVYEDWFEEMEVADPPVEGSDVEPAKPPPARRGSVYEEWFDEPESGE